MKSTSNPDRVRQKLSWAPASRPQLAERPQMLGHQGFEGYAINLFRRIQLPLGLRERNMPASK